MLWCRACKTLHRTGNAGARPAGAQRALARLMALVMLAASFAVALHEPAFATSADGQAVATVAPLHQQRPKPCRRFVLPGTVNSCPLSSFSFGFIPAVDADHAVPASIDATPWRLRNSLLRAQCHGPSLYRPPRLQA